jgi:hypothetical protein
LPADGTLYASGNVSGTSSEDNGFVARYVVNLAPTATDGTFSGEAGVLNVAAPGVLALASDPDADPLTAVLVSPPSAGQLTLRPEGSFAFDPGDASGTFQFTYEVTDGQLESRLATATVVIAPPHVVPALPAPVLAPESDTGASHSDRVTAATVLTFDVGMSSTATAPSFSGTARSWPAAAAPGRSPTSVRSPTGSTATNSSR